MNTTFEARDLWANQVRYWEPDKIMPANATQHRPLFSNVTLFANAEVVTP